MKAARAFTSLLAPDIERYLTVKQALGREYDGVRRVLAHVDHFLSPGGRDLTPVTFAGWCLTLQPGAPGHSAPSLHGDGGAPALGHCQSGPSRAHVTVAARKPPPGDRDLYTTGLRLGELVRLKWRDYDPHERTLLIRDSKFHKSRLVPVSVDSAREVDQHLAVRRIRQLAVSPDSALLWHHTRRGTAHTGTGLSHAIRPRLRAAQICTETGRVPRLHDFRHTFAIQALLRWYRAGADVDAKLPLLATYMGHVSIVSTEYYLQFVEPLATFASTPFAVTETRLSCCCASLPPASDAQCPSWISTILVLKKCSSSYTISKSAATISWRPATCGSRRFTHSFGTVRPSTLTEWSNASG